MLYFLEINHRLFDTSLGAIIVASGDYWEWENIKILKSQD